jgi:hypothetical protein
MSNTRARTPAGDAHNFGRSVVVEPTLVHKPRPLLWEWLVLGAKSPLRRLLREAAARDGAPEVFEFLPELAFKGQNSRLGGTVERLRLKPLPQVSPDKRRELAQITGRAVALFSWLGVADLHWENLALGVGPKGRLTFAPLDVEFILDDLGSPSETKLLPEADDEYGAINRHACGVRRVLPYLGKPVQPSDLLAMLGAYHHTLQLLDREARAIADLLLGLPKLAETPIRVLLRGTGDYVHARTQPVFPPLLDAEAVQLARGDIPYFFRLYGRPGIHYYEDPALEAIATLPLRGDVPRLGPLLSLSRGLRSPSRKKLREEGLFTLLGAFDHPSFTGRHESPEFDVTFRARSLVLVDHASGEELESRRNLGAFVGSVYLPCRCGEVSSVLVPAVTVCEPHVKPRG